MTKSKEKDNDKDTMNCKMTELKEKDEDTVDCKMTQTKDEAAEDDNMTEPKDGNDKMTEPKDRNDKMTEPKDRNDNMTESKDRNDNMPEPKDKNDNMPEPKDRNDNMSEPKDRNDNMPEPKDEDTADENVPKPKDEDEDTADDITTESKDKDVINLDFEENKDEQIIIVDANNKLVGCEPRKLVREKNLWHRSTSVFLFTKVGDEFQVFLHKRSKHKDYCASYYSIGFGGVLADQETYVLNAVKELHEETGILKKSSKLIELGSVKCDTEYVKSFVRCYATCVKPHVRTIPQPDEVEFIMKIPLKDLDAYLEKEQFTHISKISYEQIKDKLTPENLEKYYEKTA